MRRSNESAIGKVLSAWHSGKFRGAGNMGTDGVYIYSYSEPIATTIASGPNAGEVLILVSGEFSQTTSKHCGQVAGNVSGRVHRVLQDAIKCRSLTPTAKGLAAYAKNRGES